MPPHLVWYYMHYHPELFQREFTNGGLVLIAIISVGIAVIAILPAIIINYNFKKL